MRRIVFAAVIVLAVTFPRPCRAEDAQQRLSGTITLSGAWALYPMAVRWAEEFQKLHPDVRIDIAAGGAGKGMADALAGVVDLGMISREIMPAEIERGAFWVSVTKDAVVPVVSAQNPVLGTLERTGVTREEFTRLWLSDNPGTWGDLVGADVTLPVRVYTRSDACGAAQTWAAYLGAAQEDLTGVGVYGDPGLAEAVRRDALGIGYNNVNYAYDATTLTPVPGIAIVPIDLNGNGVVDEGEAFYSTRDALVAAIAQGVYPSPPARALHFASKGKPDRVLVVEFLRWVLSDGQAFVPEAGYIRLSDEALAAELAKLEPSR
jgi:phosphate transport system substrate-binding protein